MGELPLKPFNNLAISMSGGGFRATAFHLGTLTYLSTLQWDGQPLLNRIRVISSVSGGTFTAVNYSATIKKGGDILDSFVDLYTFMREEDLISEALAYLADDENWEGNKKRSLINAFAAIYHKKLQMDYFELLFREEPRIHLKEIIFNATEFASALPFRMQKTELSMISAKESSHGIVGNYKIRIPQDCAKEMRLADIIAASSCFPLGFEPINFPDDFIDSNSECLKNPEMLPETDPDGRPIAYPLGLMDGGIDDNQGINSVIAAERRMKEYTPESQHYASEDVKAIDLYIVSDVSSPFMDGYVRTESNSIPVVGKWSFRTLKTIGIISFIVGIAAFVTAVLVPQLWITVALSVVGTVLWIGAFLLRLLSKGFEGLTTAAGVPVFFTERLKSFDKLNFDTYANLIVNRVKSAETMVSDVFMKQIRRLHYGKLYEDDEWRPRLIMNAVYELNEESVALREKKYGVKPPSAALQKAAEEASSMGTTLWFTPEELKGDENKLDSLIACGQFNICYNLMDYISRIMKEKYKDSFENYSPELRDQIDHLYNQLEADWKRFNENPYWMTERLVEGLK